MPVARVHEAPVIILEGLVLKKEAAVLAELELWIHGRYQSLGRIVAVDVGSADPNAVKDLRQQMFGLLRRKLLQFAHERCDTLRKYKRGLKINFGALRLTGRALFARDVPKPVEEVSHVSAILLRCWPFALDGQSCLKIDY